MFQLKQRKHSQFYLPQSKHVLSGALYQLTIYPHTLNNMQHYTITTIHLQSKPHNPSIVQRYLQVQQLDEFVTVPPSKLFFYHLYFHFENLGF